MCDGDCSPETVSACPLDRRESRDLFCLCLRPGGVLVYSTCSLEPEENEEMVEALRRENAPLQFERSVNSLPFRDQTDGAYAARFVRERLTVASCGEGGIISSYARFRFDKLSKVLVEYSIRLKPGENVLIEAFDIPDAMVVALIRAVREGARHSLCADSARARQPRAGLWRHRTPDKNAPRSRVGADEENGRLYRPARKSTTSPRCRMCRSTE